ncbi:hypothetical protein [Christiangramia echinicola]|uniref:Uncharacterized protein n=1 Tax=Christiangramia echinicola TaxID=279359 RepID=A0A1H1S177_9FLAO|nr:hypothetical protein [Christiangramia echinicola]SDS41715.1 hypothetical protein SAMN04488552_3102 [Christiangramia echinicola]
MENIKAQKLLNKIQRDLMRNGIITNTLVEDLKELRKFVVEENIPLLAKVTRLTYEHVGEHEDFLIAIPDDEPIELDEDSEETEETTTLETEEVKGQESLEYMLSLMAEHDNKLNEMELREYVKALKEHAGEDY